MSLGCHCYTAHRELGQSLGSGELRQALCSAQTRNQPLPMRATPLRGCLRNGPQSSPVPGGFGGRSTTEITGPPDPTLTLWECQTGGNGKHRRDTSAGWVLQLGLKCSNAEHVLSRTFPQKQEPRQPRV